MNILSIYENNINFNFLKIVSYSEYESKNAVFYSNLAPNSEFALGQILNTVILLFFLNLLYSFCKLRARALIQLFLVVQRQYFDSYIFSLALTYTPYIKKSSQLLFLKSYFDGRIYYFKFVKFLARALTHSELSSSMIVSYVIPHIVSHCLFYLEVKR